MKKNLSCFIFSTAFFLAESTLFGSSVNYKYYTESVIKTSKELSALAEQQKINPDFLKNWSREILRRGLSSEDSLTTKAALLGVSLSLETTLSYEVALQALKGEYEEQLFALKVLTQIQPDRTDESFRLLMTSNHPLVRLETLYIMAELKNTDVALQADSLIHKLPEEASPLFIPIFLKIGDRHSLRLVKKYFSKSPPLLKQKLAALLVEEPMEEFSPLFKTLLSSQDLALKEMALLYFSKIPDHSVLGLLKKCTSCPDAAVRALAYFSLLEIDEKSGFEGLKKEAFSGNGFAISLMGRNEIFEETIKTLQKNGDLGVRANASWALLQLGLKEGADFFSPHDFFYQQKYTPIYSPSHLYFFLGVDQKKSVSSPEWEHFYTLFFSNLSKMPQKAWIAWLNRYHRQIPFVFLISSFGELAKSHSEEALNFLSDFSRLPEEDVRSLWASLYLYRVKKEKEHRNKIYSWVENCTLPLFAPPNEEISKSGQERAQSEFHLEAIKTLLMEKDAAIISLLLKKMAHSSHPIDHYPLAGLLLRALI